MTVDGSYGLKFIDRAVSGQHAVRNGPDGVAALHGIAGSGADRFCIPCRICRINRSSALLTGRICRRRCSLACRGAGALPLLRSGERSLLHLIFPARSRNAEGKSAIPGRGQHVKYGRQPKQEQT